ncbi:crossover junction endodeoxyribonuclease RuvC [Pirellula staleyi DSM 6068]|uniref:Crossover junction endodeoxyribonuclease RuvC n=1 Tax=Pirellula staleyi (strain ATCC 27377 / DSM 6068 / ICPB 4128) TaxID=530564 RepID=D2QZ57_PIRSD|nr:crossover junction endodeoxyribonuclease RuvC [Pirellula staleyi]ADB18249.1 crossover junction endodeoxyribonuclease RuvC [Pirellula staleyi DSM 6068]
MAHRKQQLETDRPRRVLGVDPGLGITGYGVIELVGMSPKIIEAGVVRGRSGATLAARIGEIYAGIHDVIQSLAPTELAIEELYSHYDRPRTAILMGHARGAILLAGHQAGIPVLSYASTQVKKLLTGNGRAPKDQMQNAVCRELKLAAPPEPPDVADALAIALCHIHLSRSGLHIATPGLTEDDLH